MITVIDGLMPRMNGVETLRRLRTQSQMPVPMPAARGDDADGIIGLEPGADDYVAMPYTPHELSARIRAILRCAHIALTLTGFSLLKLLVRQAGMPVSKSELSEKRPWEDHWRNSTAIST